MGIGALNYQGVKGGLKLNDVIEEFKYVYKGKTIKAGDFVNYINGVASGSIGTDIAEYEQQVTPSTQPPFDGIALSNGVGGDDTGHNEQVKIAKPTITYSLDGIEVVNLLTNGDFESGNLTNWNMFATSVMTATINSSTKYQGNYSMQVEFVKDITEESSYGGNTSLSGYTEGHIYYATMYVKSSSLTAIPAMFAGKNKVVGISSLEWQRLSARATFGNTVFSTGAMSATTGDKFYFDNAGVYDLTEMFGAGKEPPKEWCDANL